MIFLGFGKFARADAENDEREVQCGGPAGERDRVWHTGDRGELRLERVDVRPERRDPVRVDRVLEQLELAAGHVRGREVDAGHSARA